MFPTSSPGFNLSWGLLTSVVLPIGGLQTKYRWSVNTTLLINCDSLILIGQAILHQLRFLLGFPEKQRDFLIMAMFTIYQCTNRCRISQPSALEHALLLCPCEGRNFWVTGSKVGALQLAHTICVGQCPPLSFFWGGSNPHFGSWNNMKQSYSIQFIHILDLETLWNNPIASHFGVNPHHLSPMNSQLFRPPCWPFNRSTKPSCSSIFIYSHHWNPLIHLPPQPWSFISLGPWLPLEPRRRKVIPSATSAGSAARRRPGTSCGYCDRRRTKRRTRGCSWDFSAAKHGEDGGWWDDDQLDINIVIK